ncbi:MAG: RecX family transcriptional regulator [Cyclobacteriaceae bacterium]|nr:RecX family transcriptional regulator [Cyclobacteriaceae bacterium]
MKAAKLKAGNYCAYQERTQQEVRDKLYAIGLYSDEVEQVLTELITENYVNEERFAKSFAGGKFRLKQWGKKKIVYALKQRNISPYCIEQALKEISDEEYERVITQLVERKSNQLQGEIFIVKNKIARYLVGKGFENELVWSIVNKQLDSGG